MRLRFRIPATSANFGAGFDVFGAALKLYNFIAIDTEKAHRGAKKSLREIIEVDVRAFNKKEASQSFEGLKKLISDTVFRTIKEFNLAAGIIKKFSVVKIIFTNNAPLARGLGSSASAITGAVYAAGILCSPALRPEKLWNIACRIEGHPDNVTPAFYGGFCVAVNYGDKFDYVKIEMPGDLRAVLCVPDFGMSTEAARRILPLQVSFADAVFNASRTALMVSALVKRDYGFLAAAMDDRLHQPYRKKFIPGFDRIISSARSQGAYGVALSGAGSTIMALCPDNERLCARVGMAMTGTLLKNRLGSKYIICGFDNEGVKREAFRVAADKIWH